MANGDEAHRQYPDPFQGAMGERVTNMGRRINDVEVEMRSGFNQINQSIAALSNNLAERNKTQWPVIFLAIGVASSVLGYFVTQALTPIRDANLDMKASIVALAAETAHSFEVVSAKTVTRDEVSWRADRATEDRKRTDESVASLRDAMVYRNEWMERNLSRDHDIENIRADAVRDVANLQRQLDQQRSDFQTFSSSLGNGRDLIVDLKNEQRRLSDQIASLTAKVAAEQSATPR